MNDQQQQPTIDSQQPAKISEMPKSVSVESLTKRFNDADRAAEVYHRIASVGGFGAMSADFNGGYPALDLSGIADKEILGEIEKLLK